MHDNKVKITRSKKKSARKFSRLLTRKVLTKDLESFENESFLGVREN